MIYAYFRAKGRIERILIDWGLLPTLAIQHMYIDHDLCHSLSPDNIEEVDLVIFSKSVNYIEICTRKFGTKVYSRRKC